MPQQKQPLSHRRTHHLLLLSRLLNLRDTGASPFTLLLDSTSQSSKPLVGEFIRRANLAKCTVVFVGFESLRGPFPVTKDGQTLKHVFVKARWKSIAELQREINTAVTGIGGKSLIIIDSLHTLCSFHPSHISSFLSSLITPHSTLLATYHLDIPVTLPPQSQYPDTAPHPLTLLRYLCTTLITVHSIIYVLLQKRHRDKSLLPPRWGLLEEHPGGRGGGIEGVIVGIGSNAQNGIVLEFEHRRKSGRGVQEWFYLPLGPDKGKVTAKPGPALFEKVGAPAGALEKSILLEDHPEWKLSEQVEYGVGVEDREEEIPQTTFDLGLTEKQKKARDEVVLPYFDAQDEMGVSGGGGRILYMPEREADDWDEEEDEL
ncbi:Elongator complex protein 5 [Terfezia claveryi]|nr:Elongator complex protein 5 [Terfezia claveryi]